MTFLAYIANNNSITVGMDTLVSDKNGESISYIEKSIFFEKSKVLMSMKGSLNVLSVLAIELAEKSEVFNSSNDLINYVQDELPDILNMVSESMPDVKNIFTRAYFFYFEGDKPKVMKAELIGTPEFVYTCNEIPIDSMFSTNNTDWSDKAKDNSANLATSMAHFNEKYVSGSVESDLFLSANLSKLNDPPATYTGGKIFLYRITQTGAYHKQLLGDLDPQIIDKKFITIEEAVSQLNGFTNE